MTFAVHVADDFVPEDAEGGVMYAIRDALEFAGIPAVIEDTKSQESCSSSI